MTVAKLRIAVEDPLVAKQFGLTPENVRIGAEPFFLDGPVAERVAIVDRALPGSLPRPGQPGNFT